MPIQTIAAYRVRPEGVEKVKRAIEDFVPSVKSSEPGSRIREWARIILLVGVVTVLSSIVVAQGASTRLQPLPRAFEVKLALSAAPPHLRANATVYVLDPGKGYVLERKGTNGFTCYIERTDYLREDFGDGFIARHRDPRFRYFAQRMLASKFSTNPLLQRGDIHAGRKE